LGRLGLGISKSETDTNIQGRKQGKQKSEAGRSAYTEEIEAGSLGHTVKNHGKGTAR
jgi:hypothetical protein